MSDIIRLLPDSIANQIAAGEVIQRPASVVKELVENAVDAGATLIQVIVKDAGRTLIQVVDNGKGMSDTDARMAFERHATSKIRCADDLFALCTMGFRGEALASIAAVAHVELKSRQTDDELGSLIVINGGEIETQEPVATAIGSCFTVKNLFFNVPARRKFLKSNQTELSHIITEFERIALANPSVGLILLNSDQEVYNLSAGTIRQRILAVFGKNINHGLMQIDLKTPIVNIFGYVSSPDSSRKTNQKQYFFVNGRYMRNPYFHKAVMHSYDQLLAQGEQPHYFLYFDVEPNSIDVNIHPTKTEISFENGQPIWQMLSAAVKEALGKHNAVPSIDFNNKEAIEIPVFDGNYPSAPPPLKLNADYNPFKTTKVDHNYQRKETNWEKIYEGLQKKKEQPEETSFIPDIAPTTILHEEKHEVSSTSKTFNFKNRYIVASSRMGLMIIHARRAHIRILFDRYIRQIEARQGASQLVLFPEIISLAASDIVLLESFIDEFHYLGFELNNLGGGSFSINAVPAHIEGVDVPALIHDMVDVIRHKSVSVKEEINNSLALTLAKASAISPGKQLTEGEQSFIMDHLMASPAPMYTPDGLKTVYLLNDDELDKLFA